AGYLPPSMKQIAERLHDCDALLFVGGRGLRTTLYDEAGLTARMGWIGTNSRVQAMGAEFDLAHVADIRLALTAVTAQARKRPTGDRSARPTMEVPARQSGALHPTRAIVALLERFHDA